MITAIDTNILIALWDSKDALNVQAQNALDSVSDSGNLVVSGMFFCGTAQCSRQNRTDGRAVSDGDWNRDRLHDR